MERYRGSRGSGRRPSSSFDGRRSRGGFDSRGSDSHEMFDAVCDECGKDCKVPFKPSTDKPIYCSDCFEKKGGNRDRDSRGRGGRSRGDSDSMMYSISKKLDRIIELLEK